MQEVYISVDVESDGPIPGPHSMLSFGAAAFLEDGRMITTFTRNLDLLEGASMHPDTQRFWNDNPDAYASTRVNTVHPAVGIIDFVNWVERTRDLQTFRPVFVAYPAGFDWTFMYWYMMKFAHRSPFSFQALDMKSYAMAKLGTNFRETTKRNMPKDWFSKRKHTHVALDDAIEQGELFVSMLRHGRA